MQRNKTWQPIPRKQPSLEAAPEETQTQYVLDQVFKAVILNMFKELKETMYKELKENMEAMTHSIEMISYKTEFTHCLGHLHLESGCLV